MMLLENSNLINKFRQATYLESRIEVELDVIAGFKVDRKALLIWLADADNANALRENETLKRRRERSFLKMFNMSGKYTYH